MLYIASRRGGKDGGGRSGLDRASARSQWTSVVVLIRISRCRYNRKDWKKERGKNKERKKKHYNLVSSSEPHIFFTLPTRHNNTVFPEFEGDGLGIPRPECQCGLGKVRGLGAHPILPPTPSSRRRSEEGDEDSYARLKYRRAVDASASICSSSALHKSETGGRFADPPNKELRDKVRKTCKT